MKHFLGTVLVINLYTEIVFAATPAPSSQAPAGNISGAPEQNTAVQPVQNQNNIEPPGSFIDKRGMTLPVAPEVRNQDTPPAGLPPVQSAVSSDSSDIKTQSPAAAGSQTRPAQAQQQQPVDKAATNKLPDNNLSVPPLPSSVGEDELKPYIPKPKAVQKDSSPSFIQRIFGKKEKNDVPNSKITEQTTDIPAAPAPPPEPAPAVTPAAPVPITPAPVPVQVPAPPPEPAISPASAPSQVPTIPAPAPVQAPSAPAPAPVQTPAPAPAASAPAQAPGDFASVPHQATAPSLFQLTKAGAGVKVSPKSGKEITVLITPSKPKDNLTRTHSKLVTLPTVKVNRINPAKAFATVKIPAPHVALKDRPVVKKATVPVKPANDFDQIQFIEDEVKMLSVSDDDVVLGKMTYKAKFADMGYSQYLTIYDSYRAFVKRENAVRDIKEFITYHRKIDGNDIPYISDKQLFSLAAAGIKTGNLDTLRALTNNYKLLNITDNRGNGLLHVAAFNHDHNITKWLIMRDFDVNAMNYDSITPLEVAEYEQSWATANLLKSANAR